MNYIKTGFIACTLLFILGFTLNISLETTYKDLYTKGNNAYKNKNYVDALKYLYAYKVINERVLNEYHAEFLGKLNAAISNCELKLRQKLVVVREKANGTTSYFNGNGYEVPDYLRNFIQNNGSPNPPSFGGQGYELPESYSSYLEDAKVPSFENMDLVKFEDNKLVIDEAMLTRFLEK
ncbi:MAG: hypothetical protein IH946_02620, partial [Bacteroidetes bacterium]|nr:hypothetical protein [Bacteroidota bacterium]